MADILSPSGLEDPIGGEPHSRAMISRNWNRINDNWKPLEGPIAITLTSATWENQGTGYAAAEVYRIGDRIYLRGTINNKVLATFTAGVEYILGTITNANYQMPAAKAGQYPLMFRSNGYAIYAGTLIVSQTAGVTSLRMYVANTVTNLGANNGFVSFDNVSWLA